MICLSWGDHVWLTKHLTKKKLWLKEYLYIFSPPNSGLGENGFTLLSKQFLWFVCPEVTLWGWQDVHLLTAVVCYLPARWQLCGWARWRGQRPWSPRPAQHRTSGLVPQLSPSGSMGEAGATRGLWRTLSAFQGLRLWILCQSVESIDINSLMKCSKHHITVEKTYLLWLLFFFSPPLQTLSNL